MYPSTPAILIAVALNALTSSTLAQSTMPNSTTTAQDLNKRVRLLVRKAGESIRTGKYDEAHQALLEAWDLRHAPDIAGLLAQAEIELKRYADAANHLDFAIANFSATQSDKLLETLRQASEDAKAHVGQLRIVTNSDGADISVDGHSVGAAPLQTGVYVEPGHHEIRVTQDSNSEIRQTEVGIGKTVEVAIPLHHGDAASLAVNAPPGSSGPASVPTSPPAHETSQRSIVPVVVGGVVFAVGLGSAIGFGLAAKSNKTDAQNLAARNGLYGCGTGIALPSDCRSQDDALQSEDRNHNWSTGGLVVAGVAAVAIPVYWLWPRTAKGDSASNIRLYTSVGTGSSWVSIGGGF
jgi:hypothetical protein